jgi:threonine/homoserine/homoserine lactone efflux protein
MLNAFWQGIIPGLVLSVAIGPVFFLLIKTSIEQGFKRAMVMEAGIILSDAFCIFLAIIGLAALFVRPEFKPQITIAGGIILLLFGASSYWRTKMKTGSIEEAPAISTRKNLFVKGFLFNLSNPSVVFFWMGAVSIALPQFDNSRPEVFSYFSATILTVFSIDVLKAYLAVKIKRFLTPANIANINKAVGLAIALFGLVLLIKGFLLLGHD